MDNFPIKLRRNEHDSRWAMHDAVKPTNYANLVSGSPLSTSGRNMNIAFELPKLQ